MPRYMYLGQYNAEGIQGVVAEGGSSREAETRALFERVGARIETYLFAVGADFDFLIIAEAPDTVAAIIPPMIASAGGRVVVRTTVLMSPEELDEAAKAARTLSFRSAGD